jgi:hypothetical protein
MEANRLKSSRSVFTRRVTVFDTGAFGVVGPFLPATALGLPRDVVGVVTATGTFISGGTVGSGARAVVGVVVVVANSCGASGRATGSSTVATSGARLGAAVSTFVADGASLISGTFSAWVVTSATVVDGTSGNARWLSGIGTATLVEWCWWSCPSSFVAVELAAAVEATSSLLMSSTSMLSAPFDSLSASPLVAWRRSSMLSSPSGLWLRGPLSLAADSIGTPFFKTAPSASRAFSRFCRSLSPWNCWVPTAQIPSAPSSSM